MLTKQGTSTRSAELAAILQLNQVFIIFEAFLLDAVKILYRAFPDQLKVEKQISFKEALAFTSVKNIPDFLIEKIMRKSTYDSIQDQLKSIEKTFGIKFEFNEQNLPELASYKGRWSRSV